MAAASQAGGRSAWSPNPNPNLTLTLTSTLTLAPNPNLTGRSAPNHTSA